VQLDLSGAIALAGDSRALADDVTARLIGDNVNDELKAHIRRAVDSIEIPDANHAPAREQAKENRVYTALLLTLASPEYIVQK